MNRNKTMKSDRGIRRSSLLARLGSASALAISGLAAYRRSRRALWDMKGRVCLITGGSRGFGLLLAREFARQGAIPAVCARDPVELKRIREEFFRLGLNIHVFRCDVTDRDQIREWGRAVQERFGRIDILVNNAGIIQVGPFDTMEEKEFRQAMDINFFGMLNTTLELLPYLARSGNGRIVNITSIGGEIPVPHLLPYVASKFAAVGFSQGLRAELEKKGVIVTTVIPGLMRTGSFLRARFKGNREKEFAWFSVNASLPFLSMDAERAARKAVSACRSGRAVITLGLPAKAARVLFHLLPGTFAGIFAGITRLLPERPPKESAQASAEEGKVYSSALGRSRTLKWGTALGQKAAKKFGELG